MKNQEKHKKISTSLVSRSELAGSLRERGRERELDFGFKDFKCLNLDDYNNRAIFEETKMKAII